MNLNETFCAGLRCGKKDTCARSIDRLKEHFARAGIRIPKPISVAQYADHHGRCTDYVPREGVERPRPECMRYRSVRCGCCLACCQAP